jgi:2-phosphoglycerate kinase
MIPQVGKIKDKSTIIMISGSPAAGKSTLGGLLAKELGYFLLIGTDTIREILRNYIPEEDNPALYLKAIVAGDLAPDTETEPLTWGFREQSQSLQKGVIASVNRAITESKDLIIEGIHLPPGIINYDEFDAYIHHVILTVESEEQLRQQMIAQGSERAEGKIKNIHRALAYQDYLVKKASETKCHVVLNEFGNPQKAVKEVLDLSVF